MTTKKTLASVEPDATPVPKVVAAGVTGSVTTVLIYLAGLANVDVPPEVAAAVTTILSFIAGYMAPRSGKLT